VTEPDPHTSIRRLECTDLTFVAEQHQHHFPHGFFARLGNRFLARYYLTYCTSGDAVALAAITDGARAGYLVGTVFPGGHRRHVLEWHRSALAWEGMLGLLRNPSTLKAFARTRGPLYARKLVAEPRSPRGSSLDDGVAVLNHLVVLPEYQGQGIGTQLIAELEEAARLAGRTALTLVTETGGQGAAYYAFNGWESRGDHITRDGLRLTTYTRAIFAPVSRGAINP
jgi:ribosomal protein S18 acetylase RimI-like enzyme